jgi:hypothetical protein
VPNLHSSYYWETHWELGEHSGNMMRTQEYKNPLPPPQRKKDEPSWVYVWLSHWLHAYSIPRHGCHYFLGLIPIPQITPYLLKFQHGTNNVSACDLICHHYLQHWGWKDAKLLSLQLTLKIYHTSIATTKTKKKVSQSQFRVGFNHFTKWV